MTARQQWSQGLQWGGCAWLCYAFAHTVLDIVHPAWRDNPRGWTLPQFHLETGWPSGSWLTAALWLAAAVMVAAGAKRARMAVAVAILAQAVLGMREAVSNVGEWHRSYRGSPLFIVLGLIGQLAQEYGRLEFSRAWWTVAAFFVVLATVTVWASASVRCVNCERA